jgi:hypothetical protein
VDALPEVRPAPEVKHARKGKAKLEEKPGGLGLERLPRWWPAALAGILLVPALALGVWLLWPIKRTAPPPAPLPARLQPPQPVTIRAGHQGGVDVQVERRGSTGPLTVRVEGLPLGFQAEEVVLGPGESSARVPIRVRLEMGPPANRRITVALFSGAEKLDEQPLPLTVEPFLRPRLKPPGPVALKPGEKKTIQIGVERNGNKDPLTVKLESLPPGVEQMAVVDPLGAEGVGVELSAAPGAAPAASIAVVKLYAGTLPDVIDSQRVAVGVEKPEPAEVKVGLTVGNLNGRVSLRPGRLEMLRVRLDRGGYTGRLTLSLEGLPVGVTADAWTFTGDGAFVRLRAEKGVLWEPRAVRVVARAEGGKVGEQTFTLERLSELVPDVPRPEARLPLAQRVQIPTGDYVTLGGTWYPSPQGKRGPAVLLLHDPGRGKSSAGLTRLALALQKHGCGVLSFDFRGHGGSREVGPFFWQVPHNKALAAKVMPGRRGAVRPRTARLDVGTFPPAYYAHLVQDVAAARHFLDQRNDLGEVNSARLVVLGAGEGSSLGALWLTTEYHRYRPANFFPLKVRDKPEGADAAGAVWLTWTGTLAGRSSRPATDALTRVGKTRRLPMALVYGQNDTWSAGRMPALARSVKGDLKGLTADKPIPDTALRGHLLLALGLDTEKVVLGFVKDALAAQGDREWWARNSETTTFYYSFPGMGPQVGRRIDFRGPALVPLEKFGVR